MTPHRELRYSEDYLEVTPPAEEKGGQRGLWGGDPRERAVTNLLASPSPQVHGVCPLQEFLECHGPVVFDTITSGEIGPKVKLRSSHDVQIFAPSG